MLPYSFEKSNGLKKKDCIKITISKIWESTKRLAVSKDSEIPDASKARKTLAAVFLTRDKK